MWWCFLVLRGEIIKKICCQKWRVTVTRPKLRAHLCDGEMTWRVLLSSKYVGVGRLGDPTLYTCAYLQPIKKKSTGGWVYFENSPSRRNETKNWNSKCYAGRWELCSLWSWPYICWQLKYFYGNWRRTLFIASSHFTSNHNQVKK